MIFEMFRPVHRWIWCDAERRAHKLLRFGETETDGGRDLSVTALGATLVAAKRNAYEAVARIHFAGAFYRRDSNHFAQWNIVDAHWDRGPERL